MEGKKSITGQIIGVFVLILIVSILAGLTFMFISQLKDQVRDTSETANTTTYESSAWLNNSGYTLQGASLYLARNFNIVSLGNSSSGIIPSSNYTLSSIGVLTNATTLTYTAVSINYTLSYVAETNSYDAVNSTEAAGVTIVDYLPLIFLALIFGALLALVLKIIVPYINLGKEAGGEF